MIVLLAFGITLLLAVLLSELARRTVFSLSVLFLVAGFIIGPGILALVDIRPADPLVSQFIELALVVVLFSDGTHVHRDEIAEIWHLPGRALLLGLPLTLVAIAFLAHWIAGVSWLEGLLIGAVLSPTDPMFASAVVRRGEVPASVRRMLNVESGFNDGLALPIILIILGLIGTTPLEPVALLVDLALGIVIGVVVPWAAIWLERTPLFAATPRYWGLFAIAIGILVYALSKMTGANVFLAAFSAGIVLANMETEIDRALREEVELATQLFKYAGLLMFGSLLSVTFFSQIPWNGYLFALLVLLVTRPLGLGIALLGTSLTWRERVVAAWFGPRGFSSILYGFWAYSAGGDHSAYLFGLIALVIVGSIIATSSTDILAAQWFEKEPQPAPSSSLE